MKRPGFCELAGGGPVHTAQKGALLLMVSLPPTVGQAAVVSGYGKGGIWLSPFVAFKGAGRRVIHARPAAQPALKGGALLADVVRQPRKRPLLLRVEGLCILGAQARRPFEMGRQALLAPILCNMGQPQRLFHLNTSSMF